MPTTFHDREQAFEAKFAHDEGFRFLAVARRDKLFARWAATKMRLTEESTETLVKEVLAIPNGPGHDEALLQPIAGFLSRHTARVSEGALSAAPGACIASNKRCNSSPRRLRITPTSFEQTLASTLASFGDARA